MIFPNTGQLCLEIGDLVIEFELVGFRGQFTAQRFVLKNELFREIYPSFRFRGNLGLGFHAKFIIAFFEDKCAGGGD